MNDNLVADPLRDPEFVAALDDLVARFRVIAERLTAAMNDLSRAFTYTMTPAVKAFSRAWLAMPFEGVLSPAEQEAAYRIYAAKWTAQHPPRGLAWRKLNSRQRRYAAIDYLVVYQLRR